MTSDRLKWIISGFDWEQLTDWEGKFVESTENYFSKHGDLTERQEEILEEIYRTKGR
jgi:hypothetical protein